MVCKWNPWTLFDETLYGFGLDRKEANILMAAILLLLLADIVRYKWKQNVGEFLLKQNLWFRYVAFILLIMCILVFGEYGVGFDSNKFIYFAF